MEIDESFGRRPPDEVFDPVAFPAPWPGAEAHRYLARTDWDVGGPWEAEPDRVFWIEAATGLPCILRRGGVAAWCGYVGVPEGHPLHGFGYDAKAAGELVAHGGLTFAEACAGHSDPMAICHVAEEGGEAWWFGFDCAHSGDYTGLSFGRRTGLTELSYLREGLSRGAYRTAAYARAHTEYLARQLAEVAAGRPASGASEEGVPCE